MEDFFVPINITIITIILIVTLVFAYVSVGKDSKFTIPTFGITSVGHFIISLILSGIIFYNSESDYRLAIAIIIGLCMTSSMGGWIYAYFSGVRSITEANPVTPSPTIAPTTTST